MTSHLALNCWHELNAHLSDWAFRAYARLLQTLSQDVQDKLSLKDGVDEPYVVIFGKTQVGKTTLLLDLMGVDAASMTTVSQVLRGGRETGKSATATAMEYCRSPDHRWGVALDSWPVWCEENDLITQRIGEIREAMEAGRLHTKQPCVVHIPRHFFGEGDASSPHVRILDLPGDEPANSKEQEHVNQMAKTYMPFADMVLLVGRGDDLSFLRPEVITLPGIEDWQVMPHRFRIVTTYSYSAQSVKDLIRKDANFNVTQLRQRLIEQIQLFDELSEAARSDALYFPLEFGTSWTGMRDQEPLLYERIAPMISRLRDDLLVQIRECVSPMGRLRNTLNTHLSIKYILQKKKSELKSKLKQLREKNKAIIGELKFWEEKFQRHEKNVTFLREVASRRLPVHDFSLEEPPNASVPYRASNDAKNAADLQKMIVSHQHSLKNMRPTFRATNKKDKHSTYYYKLIFNHFKEPDYSSKEFLLTEEFSNIHKKLNNYTFDWYLSTTNYKNDLSLVTESIEKAKEQLNELFVSRWIAAQKIADIKLQSELRFVEIDYIDSINEKNKKLKERKHLKLLRQNSINDFIKITHRSNEDLERCDRFVHLLDEEYRDALDEKINLFVQAEDNFDALLLLLSCEEMRYQREKLMNMETLRTGNKK